MILIDTLLMEKLKSQLIEWRRICWRNIEKIKERSQINKFSDF